VPASNRIRLGSLIWALCFITIQFYKSKEQVDFITPFLVFSALLYGAVVYRYFVIGRLRLVPRVQPEGRLGAARLHPRRRARGGRPRVALHGPESCSSGTSGSEAAIDSSRRAAR
jgi:hypothetical protein